MSYATERAFAGEKKCPDCGALYLGIACSCEDFGEQRDQLGCVHCGYAGWRHACCDDVCIACYEPEDCPDARACRHCNPHGDIR